MKRFRLSALLLLVAIVAANLAVARLAFVGDGPASGEAREYVFLFGPMALALQFGLWRALSGRGEARPFWVGFLAGGLLVVGWFGTAFLTMSQVLLAPLNAYEALPRAFLYDVLLGGSARGKRYLLDRPGLRLAYSSASFFALHLAVSVAAGLAWRILSRPRTS